MTDREGENLEKQSLERLVKAALSLAIGAKARIAVVFDMIVSVIHDPGQGSIHCRCHAIYVMEDYDEGEPPAQGTFVIPNVRALTEGHLAYQVGLSICGRKYRADLIRITDTITASEVKKRSRA